MCFHQPSLGYCNGFILLPVVVAITLLAAIALLVSRDSGMAISNTNSEIEAQQAEYVAQAGLQHGMKNTAQYGCGPFTDLSGIAFDNGQYSTTLTTDLGATTVYTVSVDQDSWIGSSQPSLNHGSDSVLQVGFGGGDSQHALLRFDLSALPANSPILSATAWFYVAAAHPQGALEIHPLTRDWAEGNATWDSMNANLGSAVLATIPAQPTAGVWVAVNLSSTLQSWINGLPNHGFALTTSAINVDASYSARDASNAPYLEVIVGAAPTPIATLKSVGTLSNGVLRSVTRDDVTLQAGTPLHQVLQPGNTNGKDNYVYEWKSTWNYGSSSEIWVENQFAFSRANGLIRFNLSALPVNARILSARLELYQTNASLSGGDIGIYPVLSSWSEGTGNGGNGSSNWTQRDATTAWNSNGGDFSSRRYALATAPVGKAWSSWQIGELVEAWASGAIPNEGLLLYAETFGTAAHFASSDAVDSTLRPKLSISYSCACGTVCVTPQGSGNILLVVVNPTTLVPADALKKALFESWGYSVALLSESANQTDYDTAVAGADAVFISETVNSNLVGSKLANSATGIVSQDGSYNSALGFSTSQAYTVSDSINITDSGHYITLPFAPGDLSIYDRNMEQLTVSGTSSVDLQTLGQAASNGALVVLEAAAALAGGGSAAGRRVMLPLGRESGLNWNYLNSNGLLLVQRSIAWAMGADLVATPLLFVSGGMMAVEFPSGNLLVLPTAQEQLRIDLMESWGYQVNLISASDTQANFDTAIANNRVAYIPQDVLSTNLGTKLANAPIGVVNEEGDQVDELGFATDRIFKSNSQIDVLDNTHYITQPFSTGLLTFATSSQSIHMLSGSRAPALTTLAQSLNIGSLWLPSLATIETGGALAGGGNAAGRRVQMPWGGSTFNIGALTADGQTLMQRALEWAVQPGLSLGPIAHWQLDEGTGNTAVDIVGGHNGSIATSVWSQGALGGGLQVSATDNAAIVPHDDRLSITDAYTVMAWISKQDLAGYDAAIAKATSSADLNYFLGTWENEVVFGFSTSTGSWKGNFSSGANLQTDTWYHIAASFDNANDRIKVYLDGTPILDVATTFEPVTNTGNVMLGRSAIGELLSGRMDDARIYDRVLSDTEIAALAIIPPPELLAHWKLDETSGTTASDSLGSHDGTLTNGPSWDTGTIDGALSFDGNNDVVIVADDPALDIQYAITMSAWIRPNATGTQYIMRKAEFNATNGYELSLSTSGKVFFRLNQQSSANTYRIDSTSDYPTDGTSWMHIAASYDGVIQRLYINGVEEASQAASITIGSNNTDLSLGGQVDGTQVIDGMIDDARLYPGALPAAEIAALAAGGGGGPGPSACNGSYRDDFATVAWDGSSGSLDWSATPWVEVGESDGAGSGDVQILNDISNYQLRIQDNDNGGEGVERSVNLSGASSATLSFEYRRNGLDNSSDYVALYASSNGTAGPWTELPAPRIEGNGTDGSYLSYTRDISAYISGNTAIRLLSSPSMGGTDTVYFDNIEIACSP